MQHLINCADVFYVAPHAKSVEELFKCRTSDKSVIAGETIDQLTQDGSIQSLQRWSVAQVLVVGQQKLSKPAWLGNLIPAE